jgi:hypothetical protein
MFILYISSGDTTALYYPEGRNFYNLILKDSSNSYLLFIKAEDFDQTLLYDAWNMGYLLSPSNYMVVRIVAVISFFCGGKFMATNLFFSMFAFTGAWRLFRFFYELHPQYHKAFAIGILYLPTFVFWSSGILKDPLCTGALGWFTYSFYHLFYERKNVVKDAIIVLVTAYIMSVLKIYILVSYFPFLLLFIILKNVTLIKNPAVKFLLISSFLVGSFVGFLLLSDNADTALGGFASKGLTTSISKYQTSYQNQQKEESSGFSLGVEFDGSPGSLVKIAPAAIIATLYRPFIWESKKISTLFSSVESLLLMSFSLFVLFRVGIGNCVRTVMKHPLIIYCLLFSLLFALFVGATTLNFGSLVRYKIPGTPFYVISLFLINYLNPREPKSPAERPGS